MFFTSPRKIENIKIVGELLDLPSNKRRQRDRTQRALLEYQNFNFLFYLGCFGSFTQSKHNIMKVVQS
jgi:hypothetical protein